MGDDGFIVRVRGLPWSVTQDEIVTFFTGILHILDCLEHQSLRLTHFLKYFVNDPDHVLEA